MYRGENGKREIPPSLLPRVPPCHATIVASVPPDDNEFMVEHSACYRTLLKYSGYEARFLREKKKKRERGGIRALSPNAVPRLLVTLVLNVYYI